MKCNPIWKESPNGYGEEGGDGELIREHFESTTEKLEDIFCEDIYFNAFCFSAVLAPTLSHL